MSMRVRSKKKILIVHDRRRMRMLLQARLGRRGFDVSIATNEESFRNCLFSDKPDLILLSTQLENRPGPEVYDWMLAMGLDREIPVVYLGGFCEKRPTLKAIPGRALALYKKPFDSRDITRDITTLLAA